MAPFELEARQVLQAARRDERERVGESGQKDRQRALSLTPHKPSAPSFGWATLSLDIRSFSSSALGHFLVSANANLIRPLDG